MGIKTYRPVTPSLRQMTNLTNENLSKVEPEKSLLVSLKKSGGRNNTGSITCRHIGGGSKRYYRVIDFKRDKDGIEGKVATIEYDPNRSANICLIHYKDGEKRYILAPKGIAVGDKVVSGTDVDIVIGNALPLGNIPDGTLIHNIELLPGKGGQIVRSAGTSAQILGKEGRYVIIRLKSGEIRKFLTTCKATVGEVGNSDHILVNKGKAGRNRWRGIRPTVRGSVMNPNDHPHGGGEGKSPIGRSAPLSPWGKKLMGVKTRNKKKASSRLIVRRRK